MSALEVGLIGVFAIVACSFLAIWLGSSDKH